MRGLFVLANVLCTVVAGGGLLDLLQRGAALQREGDLVGARSLYDAAAEIDPQHPDLLHLRGLCYFTEGDLRRAAEHMEKSLQFAPDRADIWSNLGEAHRLLGDSTLSLAASDRAVTLGPGIAQGWFNRGVAMAHFEQFNEAERAYLRVLELAPKDDRALENLAELLVLQERFESAVLLFDRALSEFDVRGRASKVRWARLKVSHGVALHRLGDLSGAQACYSDAETALMDSDDDEAVELRLTALTNIGAVHQASGRFEEAVLAYRAVLGGVLPPKFRLCGPRNNLGSSLWQLGRHVEAVAQYEAALVAAEKGAYSCIEAHVNLGTAHYERGDRFGAHREYCKALAIDPTRGGLEVRVATMATPVIPHSSPAGIDAERAGIIRALAYLLRRAGSVSSDSAEVEAGDVDTARSCGENTGEWTVLGHSESELVIAAPQSQVERLHFYSVYHGRNELFMQRTMVELFARAAGPALRYVSPQLSLGYHAESRPSPPRPRRIRVGFASKFFHENHAHGQLLSGIMARLDRSIFEVTVVAFPNPSGGPSIAVRAAVGLTPSEEEIARRIGADGRDVVSGVLLRSAGDHERKPPVQNRQGDALVELDTLDLRGVRAALGKLNLDVLVLADSMSEPLNYFLQWARVAPVQAVFWGNPLTTGGTSHVTRESRRPDFASHQIDYFISGDGLEPPLAGHEHYGEQMVRLGSTAIWYDAIPVPANLEHALAQESQISTLNPYLFGCSRARRRAEIFAEHLPSLVRSEALCRGCDKTNDERHGTYRGACETVVLMVAQSVFKLHPAFDAALVRIVRELLVAPAPGHPLLDVHLVLLQGRQQAWTNALKSRLRRAFEQGAVNASFDGKNGEGGQASVHFHPRVKGSGAFLRLVATADVLLHPFPFGGSKTSADGLMLGIPTLTMRGAFLRGRMAHSFYRFLGAGLGLPNEDEETLLSRGAADASEVRLVARDADDYVELAVRLAKNPTIRRRASQILRERGKLIFENERVVLEWESFLHRATKAVIAGHRDEGHSLLPWWDSLPTPQLPAMPTVAEAPAIESQQRERLAALLHSGRRANEQGDLHTAHAVLSSALNVALRARDIGDFVVTDGALASIYNDFGAVQQQLALQCQALGGASTEVVVTLEDAVQSFKRAIALRWKYPLAHSNLGVTLGSMGRYEEATEHYRLALIDGVGGTRPHADFGAVYNLGNSLRENGRDDEAASLYADALGLPPALRERRAATVFAALLLSRPDLPNFIGATKFVGDEMHKAGVVSFEAAAALPAAIDHIAEITTRVSDGCEVGGIRDVANNLAKLLCGPGSELTPWVRVYDPVAPLPEMMRRNGSIGDAAQALTILGVGLSNKAERDKRINGERIHLITQMYRPTVAGGNAGLDVRRLAELSRSLALNLLNPSVQAIHVLGDSKDCDESAGIGVFGPTWWGLHGALLQAIRDVRRTWDYGTLDPGVPSDRLIVERLAKEKLVVVPCHGARVTLGSALRYAAKAITPSAQGEGVPMALANADVFFDDTAHRILDWWPDLASSALALLRWEYREDGDGSGRLAWFPRTDSQDAWILRSPSRGAQIPMAPELEVELGRPRSDNRIAALMRNVLGLQVRNPSLDIVVRHLHADERREYTASDNIAGATCFVALDPPRTLAKNYDNYV